MTPGKKRQAEYRARMLAEGKRQYSFWLTPDRAEAIRAFLAGEPSRLTPPPPEKAPEPETKTRLLKVEPSRPERLTEYEIWRNGKRLGRVWQVSEKPKWHGYPSGFNDRQFSGPMKKAVVERIECCKAL